MRVQIMWVTVVVCMTFIFIFWLWSLKNEELMSAKPTEDNKGILSELNQLKKEVPSLWQSLGAGISNIFQSIGEKNDQSGENEFKVVPEEKQSSVPPATLPLE